VSNRADHDMKDDVGSDLARWRLALERGTFEETFEALEAVVARLELGQMRLDESVACYELGVRLARRCSEILDQAELRVSRLDESIETPDAWLEDEEAFASEFPKDQSG
jgi:exodeoxyribonuclease VII small subunit